MVVAIVEEAMEVVIVEEEAMEVVIVEEEEATEVVIVEEEEATEVAIVEEVGIMEGVMVVVITPKEVKVVVVTIPMEGFNGNILSCVSDTTSEYKVESIFVVLALLVLILMFMQKMVQELWDVVIVSLGKLYETKTFHLHQMKTLSLRRYVGAFPIEASVFCEWTAPIICFIVM